MRLFRTLLLIIIFCCFLQSEAQASFYNIAFLGDSWTAGVGVTTTCVQPTMTVATCSGGQSIPDVAASTLGVHAYQNLGLGGAMSIDVISNEINAISPTATQVVVNIGANDEQPIGDGHDLWVYWSLCDAVTRSHFPNTTGNAACGFNQPNTASSYNAVGFSETPPDIFDRFSAIVQGIKRVAPSAQIWLIKPQRIDLNPTSSWSATQQMDYEWSDGIIQAAIEAQRSNVTGIIDLGALMSYSLSNFVTSGCPTSGITSCVGHPNAAGAAAIAAIIAAALTAG